VALAADVSDREQSRIAVERLVDEFGHVELLVNNAAVVAGRASLDTHRSRAKRRGEPPARLLGVA
jgi:NAD(P)-dependent dehydrogenase (short-subunit alcohol dehydrogenase family)